MLYSEDKKIIIRLAARIVESKEPEKEVIDVLYVWQKYMLFHYRVQMLYDELCIIGYEGIANFVKNYCKDNFDTDIIIDHHNAELKKQSYGIYSNASVENESLKLRIPRLEKELKNYKANENNQQVCGVFSMIVRRYLKSKQHKTASQREMVKKNINDIISELKMQQFLPADLLKYINDFDDEILPPYNAKTIIMNQHNDHYVGNVGKGGIGIDIRKDD